MATRIEQVLTEGIAQLSYLIGDDSAGTAAVIDPRRDVEVYLDLARRYGLVVTHIFETHNHADFVSGARELAARLGSAKVYLSHEGGQTYGYPHEPVSDAQQFAFGKILLTARHTPGHTPEHVSFVAAETARPEQPWGVFTGDSLFVNSAGRPDLLGDLADTLAGQLFDTLRGFYLSLPDHVILYPGHGHGSPCGASIGDRLSSTVGYERHGNPFLQIAGKQAFKQYALGTAPPEPRYYPRMKHINREGPEVLGCGPVVPGLTPKAFREAAEQGDAAPAVIDTRSMLAFGGGHIAGAINMGARPEISLWAGWMLDPAHPLLLVLEQDADLDRVLALLMRTGYTNIAGYLAGGMQAWDNAGLPLVTLRQMPVQEVISDGDHATIVDVRSPGEWEQGHIPHARHYFLPELEQHVKELDPDRPVVTYCATGYRASMAASLLQRHGFKDARSIPGSWQAWRHAGYPVAREHR